MHNNIQLENILIDNGIYKLCDFGSATTKTYKCENERDRAIAEEDIQKLNNYFLFSIFLYFLGIQRWIIELQK